MMSISLLDQLTGLDRSPGGQHNPSNHPGPAPTTAGGGGGGTDLAPSSGCGGRRRPPPRPPPLPARLHVHRLVPGADGGAEVHLLGQGRGRGARGPAPRGPARATRRSSRRGQGGWRGRGVHPQVPGAEGQVVHCGALPALEGRRVHRGEAGLQGEGAGDLPGPAPGPGEERPPWAAVATSSSPLKSRTSRVKSMSRRGPVGPGALQRLGDAPPGGAPPACAGR